MIPTFDRHHVEVLADELQWLSGMADRIVYQTVLHRLAHVAHVPGMCPSGIYWSQRCLMEKRGRLGWTEGRSRWRGQKDLFDPNSTPCGVLLRSHV